jgi:hypothetical protein
MQLFSRLPIFVATTAVNRNLWEGMVNTAHGSRDALFEASLQNLNVSRLT